MTKYLDRYTTSMMVMIDSSTRSRGTASNFSYNLAANLGETVRGFRVNRVTVPFKFYPINSSNNLIYFQENLGAAVTATITPGSYTIATLITEIQTEMNLVSPNARTYTVTYDTILDLFTITGSAGTYRMLFGTNTASSASSVIGFSNVDTSLALAQTGDRGPVLSGVPNLFLRSNFLGLSTPQRYILADGISNAICAIAVNVNFNNLIIYDNVSNNPCQCNISNFNTIDFMVTDYLGNIIDLRGANITIELELFL